MEGREEAGAVRPPEAMSAGEAPVDPKQLAAALLRRLHRVPWVSLGAIGTGLGVGLLFAYFRSIDFMPSDIPSILGASVFVALLALVLYLGTVLSLMAPVWAFREFGLSVAPSETMTRPRLLVHLALPSLQFLGVGLFLLFIGARGAQRCDVTAPWFLTIGICLAVLGLVAWGAAEWATAGQRRAWWRRLAAVLGVCLYGCLPFGVFVEVLATGEGASWWSLGFAALLWVALAFGAGWVRWPLWAYGVVVSALALVLLLSVPILMGRSTYFPAKVAEFAGIRASKADELRVPDNTCRLIHSAIGERSPAKPLRCDGTEWGTVHARVLSSFGPRWLIEVQTAAANESGAKELLRLTIPGDGVHLVRAQPAAPKDACRPALPLETGAAKAPD